MEYKWGGASYFSDAMDIANAIITIVMTTHGRKIQSSTFLLLD